MDGRGFVSADEVGRPACGGRLGVAQGLVKGSIVLNIGTHAITGMHRDSRVGI